jgi:hypothetical protein
VIRRILSTVLEVAGVACIAAALSVVSPWLSLGFVGLACIVASYVLGGDRS